MRIFLIFFLFSLFAQIFTESAKESAQRFTISYYNHLLARNPDILHADYYRKNEDGRIIIRAESAEKIRNFNEMQLAFIKMAKEMIESSGWRLFWNERRAEIGADGLLKIEEVSNGKLKNVQIAIPDGNIEGGFKLLRQIYY